MSISSMPPSSEADFITLGELDDSPGIAVVLGNFLDDMQLLSASSLMRQVSPHSPYEQRVVCLFPQSDVSPLVVSALGSGGRLLSSARSL
jgi:hypothetical protein